MNLNFTKIKNIYHSGAGMILAGIVCLLVLSISSCNKGSDSSINAASLAIAAGSPDMVPTDLYLNSGLASSNLMYGSYVSYISLTEGPIKIGFDYTGTTTHLTGDTVNLAGNKTYTLFSSDLVAKHDFLLVTDTIVTPASGKASIRLVNMSPDAPAVDLVVGGKTLISNKSYKQVSSFTALTTSVNDTLRVVQTGTNTVLGVVNAVTVQSGMVYTIWLSGFASGLDGYGLQANLMRNAAL